MLGFGQSALGLGVQTILNVTLQFTLKSGEVVQIPSLLSFDQLGLLRLYPNDGNVTFQFTLNSGEVVQVSLLLSFDRFGLLRLCPNDGNVTLQFTLNSGVIV